MIFFARQEFDLEEFYRYIQKHKHCEVFENKMNDGLWSWVTVYYFYYFNLCNYIIDLFEWRLDVAFTLCLVIESYNVK